MDNLMSCCPLCSPPSHLLGSCSVLQAQPSFFVCRLLISKQTIAHNILSQQWLRKTSTRKIHESTLLTYGRSWKNIWNWTKRRRTHNTTELIWMSEKYVRYLIQMKRYSNDVWIACQGRRNKRTSPSSVGSYSTTSFALVQSRTIRLASLSTMIMVIQQRVLIQQSLKRCLGLYENSFPLWTNRSVGGKLVLWA